MSCWRYGGPTGTHETAAAFTGLAELFRVSKIVFRADLIETVFDFMLQTYFSQHQKSIDIQ